MDALLHARRQVACLILALPCEHPVGPLEPVPGIPQRRRGHEEDRAEHPVPAEQQRRTDEDRQHVHDEEHESERDPATQHADVLHHAAEQLTRLPPVVERDRQALQTRVERLPDVVLHERRRCQHEPPPQPHHEGLGQAEAEDRGGSPRDENRRARGDRAAHDLLEDERDHEGEDARAESAHGAERQSRQDGLGERDEARERTRRREAVRSRIGLIRSGGGHDPCGSGGADRADEAVGRRRMAQRSEGVRSGERTDGTEDARNAPGAREETQRARSGRIPNPATRTDALFTTAAWDMASS